MRWRLLRLNWAYGLGELVIVVVGVLIALSVEQWNRDRLARVEEADIIERLISDLSEDLEGWESQLRNIDEKEASLRRIQSIFAADNDFPEDPETFLQDLVGGANYGWNQYEALPTTFEEILSSGRFNLIRDAGLRVKIADYYRQDTGFNQRIDERETDYPRISYSLVPRKNEGRLEAEESNTLEVEPDLDGVDIEELLADIFASPIRNRINAEMNLARFIRNTGIRMQSDCVELVGELERYRDTIR